MIYNDIQILLVGQVIYWKLTHVVLDFKFDAT